MGRFNMGSTVILILPPSAVANAAVDGALEGAVRRPRGYVAVGQRVKRRRAGTNGAKTG